VGVPIRIQGAGPRRAARELGWHLFLQPDDYYSL